MSRRQRHVFPNREIPHLWAHQTQGEARNGTGSFYFRGATIYSYGSHFPIATHVKGSQGQPGVLFTSEKNSVTTSQHMSMVHRSIPPDVPVFTVPCQRFGFSEAEDKYQHEKNLKHYTREVAEHLITCVRARSSYNKEYQHERAALRVNIPETSLVPLINEQKGEKEEIRDEREFSWCCPFPWGFGCRCTPLRGSQSGRRSGAGFAAGSRSSCQTEAADLHSGLQTTHLARSRSRSGDARWSGRPTPPRRSVLVSADLLAARAGPWNPRGSDPTETRAEVQAQPDGRRSPETSPTKRSLDRRSA